jgi:hypothetical protein
LAVALIIESAHAGFLSFFWICKDTIFITSVQIFLFSFSFAKVQPPCAIYMHLQYYIHKQVNITFIILIVSNLFLPFRPNS